MVVCRHVRDLMRHHRGQFRFMLADPEEPGVEVDMPARQCERVDRVRVIDHGELERYVLARRDAREPVADHADVRLQLGILVHLLLRLDLRGKLAADLHLLLSGQQVHVLAKRRGAARGDESDQGDRRDQRASDGQGGENGGAEFG